MIKTYWTTRGQLGLTNLVQTNIREVGDLYKMGKIQNLFKILNIREVGSRYDIIGPLACRESFWSNKVGACSIKPTHTY